jgi:RimJ/RimL family protein N-acetyltransferase
MSVNDDNRTPVVYRVETSRLILRCWSPEDAPALRQALDESGQHLRPWIPFMKDEPRTLQQTLEWLRLHRSNFDADRMYRFGVFSKADGSIVGENMLLDRVGPGGLEVGYWTHVAQGGQGFATEASGAMVRTAFEVYGVDRVEIHCAPANQASASIPAKLGFSHEATLRRRASDTEGKILDLMIWTLFAADYKKTWSASLAVEAFDCTGEQLL